MQWRITKRQDHAIIFQHPIKEESVTFFNRAIPNVFFSPEIRPFASFPLEH